MGEGLPGAALESDGAVLDAVELAALAGVDDKDESAKRLKPLLAEVDSNFFVDALLDPVAAVTGVL